MSSNVAGPHRLLLTLGLAMVVAASLPLSAGAEGAAHAAAARASTTAATAVLNHPPAWTEAIVRTTVARLEALAAPKPAVAAPVAHKAAAPKPVATRATTKNTATKTTAVRVYAGTNHLWIPSLGISHAVAFFSCTRSTPPGAGVYRWGCAGRNNTYLFGHAWSTFKPLHDAYVSGHLHTGMVVYYADASGHVRRYKVTAIKVVTPDQTAWAIAAQSVPSMTLQTCVGSRSQYRLLVRLVATT